MLAFNLLQSIREACPIHCKSSKIVVHQGMQNSAQHATRYDDIGVLHATIAAAQHAMIVCRLHCAQDARVEEGAHDGRKIRANATW